MSTFAWDTLGLIGCLWVGIPTGFVCQYASGIRFKNENSRLSYIPGATISTFIYYSIFRLTYYSNYIPLKLFGIGTIIGNLMFSTIINWHIINNGNPSYSEKYRNISQSLLDAVADGMLHVTMPFMSIAGGAIGLFLGFGYIICCNLYNHKSFTASILLPV